MPLDFRYFRGLEDDMGLLPYIRTCSLCGQQGRCFSLNGVISREFTEQERQGKVGCTDCLKRDRFGFPHDTAVGFITVNGLETFGEPPRKPRHVFIVASDGEATATTMPLVYPPKPQISEESVAELRRTPSFATWQELSWPVHCDDFMAFAGYSETGVGILFECLHCEKRTEIDDPD